MTAPHTAQSPVGAGLSGFQNTNTPILTEADAQRNRFDTLAARAAINAAHANAIEHADKAIGYARQAGELLLRVKDSLPHGEFLPWVTAHCTVTTRQAQRYMSAAKGKPTPLRAIKPEAIKYDTVSYLEVKADEAIHITRLAGNWRDEIHVYPDAEHPGSFHYAHTSGQVGHGTSCSYTKRGISAKGIGLNIWLDMPDWRDGDIKRMKHPGYIVNPFAAEDVAEALATENGGAA